MTKNAQVIEKRHQKECSVCMLIDSEDVVKKDNIKFHVVDSYDVKEKHICSDCLAGLTSIRKMCHQKIDNPSKPIFKDFTPWVIEEIYGKANGEKLKEFKIDIE